MRTRWLLGLSILIGFGVVACSGGDDDDDVTPDPMRDGSVEVRDGGSAARDGGDARDGGEAQRDGGEATRDGGAGPSPFPDTIAGEALEWLITVSLPGEPIDQATYEARFSEPYRRNNSLDDVNTMIFEFAFTQRDFVANMEVEAIGEHVARASGTVDSATMRRVTVVTSPTAPNVIDLVSIVVAPERNPNRDTPLGPQEGFVTVGASGPVTVSTLNPTDGLPYDPPVEVMTDAYGLARVTLPDEGAGLRIDGPNFDAFTVWAAKGHRGADAFYTPFDLTELDTVATNLGQPLTGGLGHVFSRVVHHEPLADGTVRQTGVGCASFDSTPASMPLFSGVTDFEMGQTETYPTRPEVLVPNLGAGAHTFTSTAGTSTTSVRVPRIEPDAVTYVVADFSAPETVANPTPSGCLTEMTRVDCDVQLPPETLGDRTGVRITNETSGTIHVRRVDDAGVVRGRYVIYAGGRFDIRPRSGRTYLAFDDAGTCLGRYRSLDRPSQLLIR